MKIAIIGPGGIGCLFSALLSKAGHEVWLIDRRPDRAALIAREGICVERENDSTIARPGASAFPADIGPVDLIMLCVKAHETAGTAPSIKALLGPATDILSLQNGLGNTDAILHLATKSNLFAGVTTHGATVIGLNHVRHAGGGTTVIGSLQDNVARAARLAKTLAAAGIESSSTTDTAGVLWSKLVINAAICPVSVIAGLSNGELAGNDKWRSMMGKAAAEGAAVAAAKGIKLTFDDPLKAVLDVCRTTSANISSMLQDVRRGRQTEIEAINGAVVRAAAEAGVDAPVNAKLYKSVVELEQLGK